jgi:hypothetical protein
MTRDLVALFSPLMIHAGTTARHAQPIIRPPLRLKSATSRFASFADITRLT